VTKGFGVSLLVAEILGLVERWGLGILFYCYLEESFLLKGFEDEDGIEQSLSEEVEIG
jgi:hypothetical protein